MSSDDRPDELSEENLEALTAILENADELMARYGYGMTPPMTWRRHIEALTTFAVTLLLIYEDELTSTQLIETVLPAVWTAFGMGVQAQKDGAV